MCLSVEWKKGGKNYQSTYKEKSGIFIQSLLPADETASIVKHSEHMIKLKDDFVALEDEALTKVAWLPQSLAKT